MALGRNAIMRKPGIGRRPLAIRREGRDVDPLTPDARRPPVAGRQDFVMERREQAKQKIAHVGGKGEDRVGGVVQKHIGANLEESGL